LSTQSAFWPFADAPLPAFAPPRFTNAGIGKLRGPRKKPPEALLKIVGASDELRVQELAEAMAGAIEASGELTTKALREAVAGHGGREMQSAAIRLLESENPPRVVWDWGVFETTGGRQRAKIWRVADRSET